MTQSIATDPITFAFEKKKNLLLVGPHGVGKTTRPIQMFEENKVPFLFFNCPTMDVYEDLRGIPTVVDGKLKYIKPSHIEWDKAEFILLDEPNRAHIKVIGTLYELIQFKRINGHVLPNLKAVWATMNPSDGEYAVEQLDNSFFDRFQVRVDVKPRLDKEFFLKKFDGFLTAEIFEKIFVWWNSIPTKEREQNASPRRVEYAVETARDGGNPCFTLPSTCNPQALASILLQGFTALPESTEPFTHDEAREFIVKALASTSADIINPKDVLRIPTEVLCGRFTKDTRNDNQKFSHMFSECVDHFHSCPSLLISIAKSFTIQPEFRKNADNTQFAKYPGLARAVSVTRIP